VSELKQANIPKKQPRLLSYGLIVFGGLVALVLVVGISGTVSAETVFDNSLDKMLQTESVVMQYDFTGKASDVESIDLQTSAFFEMIDEETMRLDGDFALDIITEGVPIQAEAEYIAIDDDRYIKFTKLASTNAEVAAGLEQIQSKVLDKWIKAREGDSFSNFVDAPIDALTGITALPYANLTNENRDKIVEILRDEASFTIQESAEVTLSGEKAYRYDLKFDEDKQDEMANELGSIVGYLKPGGDDSASKVESLQVWIGINDERIMKMEYSGAGTIGEMAAVVMFSNYNSEQDISQPEEYYVESELIQ
jgi:hypothetical protein